MYRERTKLPDLTIDGHVFQITVDNAGVFRALMVSDTEYSFEAANMADLKKKMTSAVRSKKVRLAVEITLLHDGPKYIYGSKHTSAAEPAVITGVHARNGNLMIKRADGKTGQYATYDFAGISKRLSEPEGKQWVALCAARDAAANAVEQFIADHNLAKGGRRKDVYDYIKTLVEKESGAAVVED